MRIFIIAGKSGSGKNTTAKLIKKYYDTKGQKTMITEFSKYLKMYAYEFLGSYDESNKPRKFLQELGDEVRKINSDFLINRLKEDIEVYKMFYDNVVICDARLINEIEAMKEYYLNCTSIHLASNKENNLTEKQKHHKTELELDGYPYFDYNIEYVFDEQLECDVKKMLEEVK